MVNKVESGNYQDIGKIEKFLVTIGYYVGQEERRKKESLKSL